MRFFCHYHPLILFTYFLTVLIISMFTLNPIFGIISIFGALSFWCSINASKPKAKSFVLYLVMFLAITITNPLFSHNGVTPLFFINGQAITLEAFYYGAGMATMLIAVIIWCSCFSSVMDSEKIIFLFGKISPKLALIISMTLGLIPTLKRQVKKIQVANKVMGIYSSEGFLGKIRNFLKLFLALISWGLERSIEISKSMRARAYGTNKRTYYSNYKFSVSDISLGLIIFVLFVVIIIGISIGKTDFCFYPALYITKLDLAGIITYFSFLVLSLLPFIIETGGCIKWNYYRSKI